MRRQLIEWQENHGGGHQIDESRTRDHFGELVRGIVEETLNAILDALASPVGEAVP